MKEPPRLEIDRDSIRERLNKYTREAYKTLPRLDKPQILDIGCVSGVPTIELARLSNGEIFGVDIDQSELDKLNRKIQEKGLSERVKTVRCSLFELEFPDESFDIIWSEGSIAVIGFERGLKEWRRLLKPRGFLVVHDEMANMGNKLKTIPSCGYALLDNLTLRYDTWWTEYYCPLENYLKGLRERHANDPQALRALKKHQDEVDMVKANPKRSLSVFFIMQKQ
jgi:ubiquinone/menaquinone biosynthesis C-methylase UbiE